jgi:hypothetical protein
MHAAGADCGCRVAQRKVVLLHSVSVLLFSCSLLWRFDLRTKNIRTVLPTYQYMQFDTQEDVSLCKPVPDANSVCADRFILRVRHCGIDLFHPIVPVSIHEDKRLLIELSSVYIYNKFL